MQACRACAFDVSKLEYEDLFAWLTDLRLRWKVLFAPAFLILVLIGVGAYALYEQRANQTAVDALMIGPVRQAATVADLSMTAWTAQVDLYRLMATVVTKCAPRL
jgi:hypothetical protein